MDKNNLTMEERKYLEDWVAQMEAVEMAQVQE